jgi:uncharacterized protein
MSTAKIFHHNDADGRCSAFIMGNYCEELGYYEYEYISIDYKDRVPLEIIQPQDFVAIVDFSFTPEIMAQVEKLTRNIIWCDHHVTAKDYGYNHLPGYRDFSEKGLSGCECTWKACHLPEDPIPEFCTLLGDYDSWRLEKTPECFQFYEGLKLRDTHPHSVTWKQLLNSEHVFQAIVLEGKIAIGYRDNYCAELRKAFGYETELLGIKAYALNTYMFGSSGFGYKFKEYPICIAYIHDGKRFTVSLYSETIDVSSIAKQYGGGGHKGAAGFTCLQLPWLSKIDT